MSKRANTIIMILDSILSLLVIVFIPVMPALFGKNAHWIYCIYMIVVLSVLVVSLALSVFVFIQGVKERHITDKSNSLLVISYILLLIAFVFIIFASNNPQMSFIWPINISYLIYMIYITIMIAVFLTGIIFKIKAKER